MEEKQLDLKSFLKTGFYTVVKGAQSQEAILQEKFQFFNHVVRFCKIDPTLNKYPQDILRQRSKVGFERNRFFLSQIEKNQHLALDIFSGEKLFGRGVLCFGTAVNKGQPTYPFAFNIACDAQPALIKAFKDQHKSCPHESELTISDGPITEVFQNYYIDILQTFRPYSEKVLLSFNGILSALSTFEEPYVGDLLNVTLKTAAAFCWQAGAKDNALPFTVHNSADKKYSKICTIIEEMVNALARKRIIVLSDTNDILDRFWESSIKRFLKENFVPLQGQQGFEPNEAWKGLYNHKKD